jgi:hypothetical protein
MRSGDFFDMAFSRSGGGSESLHALGASVSGATDGSSRGGGEEHPLSGAPPEERSRRSWRWRFRGEASDDLGGGAVLMRIFNFCETSFF